MKRRRMLLAVLAVVAILVVTAWLALRPSQIKFEGVKLTFVAITNLPNNHLPFALFRIENTNSSAIRWHGNWSEVEGIERQMAPIVNRGLPWLSNRTTPGGGSLVIGIGEPSEDGRWRFDVVSSPYGLRERLFDFSWQHNLPMRIGPVQLFDVKQMLNPTNRVTNHSVWLEKSER